MTFGDWVRETRERYQTQPPARATARSAKKFVMGANRRVVDPYVGRTWWQDDWDVLVVLDAMRVDQAREVLGDQYDIHSRWSAASTSIDWIERHFDTRHREHYQRAGYVTANPFADNDSPHARSADLPSKQLAHLDCVYRDAFTDLDTGIATTPPERVTDRAIYAWRNEDVDRMIVHYMQPHQPFRSKPEWDGVYSNLEDLVRDVNQGGADIWKRCRDGDIDRDELWRAYCDNLRWVWRDVSERLLTNLDADVVVTADHGNGLGEWGCWSHVGGQLAPSVRKVPWWRVQATDQETVDGEQPSESETAGVDTDAQLEALGYR